MLLAGADSLREVIAFPKTGGGFDPLTSAPGADHAGAAQGGGRRREAARRAGGAADGPGRRGTELTARAPPSARGR